jgi:hypothetical protein
VTPDQYGVRPPRRYHAYAEPTAGRSREASARRSACRRPGPPPRSASVRRPGPPRSAAPVRLGPPPRCTDRSAPVCRRSPPGASGPAPRTPDPAKLSQPRRRNTTPFSVIASGERRAGICYPWCPCFPRPFLCPLIPAHRPGRGRGYDVDVPAMSLELHEWDIHALCSGTGDARVTGVRLFPVVPASGGKLTGRHARYGSQARPHSAVASACPPGRPKYWPSGVFAASA